MKVIVTHGGKQYVNRLLLALDRAGWLSRFFTGFAANTLLPYFSWLPQVQHQLRKREFKGINQTKIKAYMLSSLSERIFSSEFNRNRIASRLFDQWVARQLAGAQFDLIISYENDNLLSFCQAKKLGKVTVLDLAQVHHKTINDIKRLFRVSDLTDRQTAYVNQRKQAALDQTDYILTLSSFATKSLIANGIDRSRIYVVNLGIDVQNFSAVSKPRDGRFRMLFVGTITYRKGVDLLLQTVKNLNLPNSELVLVGPISDGKDLLALCTGTIRHVSFLHHSELALYYQQADVFVFPSYLDSWGQVVLEAMASGTPVIVTESTGAKDAVAKGGGFVVPAGDGAALAEKIEYFYNNRTEVERIGREARRVAEQYTWENYYQQVTDALMDIARRESISLHSN